MIRRSILAFALIILLMDNIQAQPKGYLYDEDKVPQFVLPDPLKFQNGEVVKTTSDWKKRRGEIFNLFESQVFGKSPARPKSIKATSSLSKTIANGKILLRQIEIDLTDSGPAVSVLMFLPANATGPVPAFLGLNFNGNHTVHPDEEIAITKSWVRNNGGLGAVNNQASEMGRGASQSRWSVQQITDAGFAAITCYYGDIDPDFDDGWKNGLHAHIRASQANQPKANEWGSIAAWSWGLSRIVDYLETEDAVDAKSVFVVGHSRLGKTSLWAGANDTRFAGVISNNSGCGGAALSKRAFGETVKRINTSFPHWFCDNFNKYNDNEQELPVDQHMLLALSAPRPVYVASASKDLWADPMGEFLSAKHASPVYKLLTGNGLNIDDFPNVNTPTIGVISYHVRDGKHNITPYDWKQYITFAKKALSK